MSGAILPLPQYAFMLKHRENFMFTFTFLSSRRESWLKSTEN
jgi:hypothetical protein